MLELSDVHAYYGESHILNGVTLRVGAGEAVGLLGRNGAGKTTTIKSIIGFIPPRRGSIVFNGKNLTGRPPHEIARGGIGLVPQGRGVFRSLTVRENLTMAARAGKGNGWTLDRAFQRFPRLGERQKNYGDQLSGGEQQMLAVARALMTNPTLLLMDEPSEGLAPMVVREIGAILAELKQEGVPLLLVEQNLLLALDIVDRLYVMNKGTVVFEGTPRSLLANETLHRQYLGV
ncbi:MAG: ABC transporter ATP-binding protein [Chloroflexi bacterium]|nr:ABC transporter ATP-binding protein [Chloroflexota bacterium]